MSIEIVKVIAYVFTALVSVGVSLRIFSKNEKRKREFFKKTEENKRSFHFIEKTWAIKHNLFEELVTNFFEITDYFTSTFMISNISFGSNVLTNLVKLISWAEITNKKSDYPVISKENFEKLCVMNEDEISSNKVLLAYIKISLMNYYSKKYLEVVEENIGIRSKLELIIFDRSIIDDYGSITKKFRDENGKLFESTVFDGLSFNQKREIEFRVILKKMRKELIETIKLNLDQLQEKMMM